MVLAEGRTNRSLAQTGRVRDYFVLHVVPFLLCAQEVTNAPTVYLFVMHTLLPTDDSQSKFSAKMQQAGSIFVCACLYEKRSGYECMTFTLLHNCFFSLFCLYNQLFLSGCVLQLQILVVYFLI